MCNDNKNENAVVKSALVGRVHVEWRAAGGFHGRHTCCAGGVVSFVLYLVYTILLFLLSWGGVRATRARMHVSGQCVSCVGACARARVCSVAIILGVRGMHRHVHMHCLGVHPPTFQFRSSYTIFNY